METIDRTIAIDFGTSTSVIYYKDSDKPSPTPANIETKSAHSQLIPTVAYMDPNGPTLFGFDAHYKGSASNAADWWGRR